MEEREPISFDPMEMRARLAARDEFFAAFLRDPLHADEAGASMPGLHDYFAYRRLPPEEQDPPGLNSGDFANAFRDIPHPAGVLAETRAAGLRRYPARPDQDGPPDTPDSVNSVDSV